MKKIVLGFVLLSAFYACSKNATSSKAVADSAALIKLPITVKDSEVAKEIVEELNATVAEMPLALKAKTIGNTNLPKGEFSKHTEDSTEYKKKMLLVKNGQEIFNVKCTKCHEPEEPKSYNEAKWELIVEWMAPRAKLDSTEKVAVLAYVKHYAKK